MAPQAAPQAAPQELSRDPRVRQTLELQRKAAEQLKKTGADSPRTKGLIANLSAILGAYGMADAEIRNLIKRCNYNDSSIQAAVSHIIEERSGHEHGAWATTATASDKKARVQEAKERRERREREKEEEVERQKQDRQRQAEEVRKKAKEEAQRIRAEEAERQRRVAVAVPAPAPEQHPERSVRADRQERSSAWRAPEAPEEDLAVADDSPAPADVPVEGSWGDEGDEEEAEAEDEAEAEEEAEEDDVGDDDENEEDEAEETAAQSASPLAESWQASDVAAVPEASMPSAPPSRDPWNTAPPAPQSSPWAAPNLLDGKPWCPGQVSDQPSAASLPAAQVSGTRAGRNHDGEPTSPTVVMPASYKALIGDGPQPFIQFGTLYQSDSVPAASSTKPLSSPEEEHASQVEEDPAKEKTRDGQDEGRAQRAPRGGRRNKGNNDWGGGAQDEAKVEGQGKGKSGAKGDGEGRSQKKEKDNKGEGKGKGKSQGKAEGKGGAENKGESKGEAKGESKGEGKSGSSRARGGKWRSDKGDRGGGK